MDQLSGKGRALPGDVPLWREFVGAPWEGWTKDRFYANVDLFEAAEQRRKKNMELGDGDHAMLGLSARIKAAQKKIKALRKEEQTDEIKAEMDRIMTEINKAVLDLKKQPAAAPAAVGPPLAKKR
jgi:hypothetical protein